MAFIHFLAGILYLTQALSIVLVKLDYRLYISLLALRASMNRFLTFLSVVYNGSTF